MKEFEYSSKGKGMIHAYRWEPTGTPIAILQIVHGIAEHMFRYDALARYMNAHGVLVVGEDHMGHGKSHGSGADVYFADGWYAAVDDTYELLRLTHAEFPETPYFLMGHSMGSFMTRTILFRYPDAPLHGAMISGTGWQPALVLFAGRAVCALERLRLGETGQSKLLKSLMFGAYNKKFKDASTPNDWISSMPDAVEAYGADPLCGRDASVGISRDMLQGIGMIQKKKNLRRMNKTLPVLFVAGKSDPVGDMGRGVEKAYRSFLAAGMERTKMQLYDGRHELLNDTNRLEVCADLWSFMEHLL